jgi:hypothetical protein
MKTGLPAPVLNAELGFGKLRKIKRRIRKMKITMIKKVENALRKHELTALGICKTTGCTCPATKISQLREVKGLNIAKRKVKINGIERNVYKIIS